jgi:polyphenol oxidase
MISMKADGMERKTHDGLAYYQFGNLGALRHGIFTRHGGASPAPWAALNLGGTVGDDPAIVRHNQRLILDALGLNAARACTVWQVHSADTVVAQGPVVGRRWLAQADGLVTDRADTPLVMRFADCTPLLFHDARQGVIGIAHAGWRGTVQGAAASVVRTMQRLFGCQPQDISAAIGPSIGPARYQVGEEVVAAARAHFGAPAATLFQRDPADGTAYFDLWQANRLDLQRVGVENVEISGLCTATRTDEFYSHRAEHGRTGRFGAVISL